MSIRVKVCSWNVGTSTPTQEDFTEWLGLDQETAQVYAIGLQEVKSRVPSLMLDYYVRENVWTRRIISLLAQHGVVMVKMERMLGMIILVAVYYDILPYVKEIRTGSVKTALYGLLGLKGGCGVRFDLFGEKFCFVTSHFTSGEDNGLYRNNDYEMVYEKMIFPNTSAPKIENHRYIFFFGDFNYKICDASTADIVVSLKDGNYSVLLAKDELSRFMSEFKCFKGFLEGPIQFCPTFKYDTGSNNFDTSIKQRKPAWADRILWKEIHSETPSVSVTSYTSYPQYTLSDHKPVSASFSVHLGSKIARDPIVVFSFEPSMLPWKDEEGGCVIQVKPGYKTSSWDWIGVYLLGFRSATDYFTYEWSYSDIPEQGCRIFFEDVPDEPGAYVLCYYSNELDCIIGISDPFPVEAPSEEPAGVVVEASSEALDTNLTEPATATSNL